MHAPTRPRLLSFCIFLVISAQSVAGPLRVPEIQIAGNAKVGTQWLYDSATAFCYFVKIGGDFREKEFVHVAAGANPDSGNEFWFSQTSSENVFNTVECSFSANFGDGYQAPEFSQTPSTWSCETRTIKNPPELCCAVAPPPDSPPGTPGQCPPFPLVMCSNGGSHQVTTCGNRVIVQSVGAVGVDSCYLAQVQGNLNGYKENIEALESSSVSGSQLYITSGASNGTTGQMACLRHAPPWPNNVSQTYRWEQGQPPVQMIPAQQGVCFLTGIGGDFTGKNEWVAVVRGDLPSNSATVLTGHSNSKYVWAAARCLDYEGVKVIARPPPPT